MDKMTAREVIAALPRGRTVFRYRRDGYAPMLLRWRMEAGETWREATRGPLARLAHKPIIRDLVRELRGRDPTPEDLARVESHGALPYRLTLGLWGCRCNHRVVQTSRPGTNLVLQLNFDGAHNERYVELVDPWGFRPFEMPHHPVSRDEHTLAWARLDLDFDADEALIEEVQSDWVREAKDAAEDPHWFVTDALERAERLDLATPGGARPLKRWHADLAHYVGAVLPTRATRWEEAMLAAALWFAREELGLATAFAHRWRTGCLLKHIEPECGPPRSLYEVLPDRVGLTRTRARPAMLEARWRDMRDGLNGREPHFWSIDLVR